MAIKSSHIGIRFIAMLDGDDVVNVTINNYGVDPSEDGELLRALLQLCAWKVGDADKRMGEDKDLLVWTGSGHGQDSVWTRWCPGDDELEYVLDELEHVMIGTTKNVKKRIVCRLVLRSE